MKLPQLRFIGISSLPFLTSIILLGTLATILPAHMLAATMQLDCSPTNLAYGDVVVGESKTLHTAVTNNGPTAVTITSVDVNSGQFEVSGLKLPKTLAVRATLNVDVIFAPTKNESDSGQLIFHSNAKNTKLTLDVSGTGTSKKVELTLRPAALSFGNVAVGTTATLTLGLSASGGSVTVSSISSTSSQFAVPGVDLPLTIASGKELLINVTFTPKKDGNTSGDLSLGSNATGSPASESLAGTGTAPYVSLAWDASRSDDIHGYNVYRSTSKNGSETKITSNLDRETSYNDTTVVSGKTYYYSTTAVNSSGQESPHSEKVNIAVP